MKQILLLIMFLAISIFAKDLFFAPINLTELKDTPSESGESVTILTKGTLVLIKSIATDSAGNEWYFVKVNKKDIEGFALSHEFEFIGDNEKSNKLLKLKNEKKEDKKKRIKELRNHKDWPRRIIRAIRSGSIILSMTTEQLFISWNQPYTTTKGFIVGLGDVKILFYNIDSPIAVVIKNNEVVGWSEKSD